MTPIDWATRPLKKYAGFSGRASRSEFWWYALLVIVAAVVGMILDSALSLAPIVLLYGPLTLAVLVATFIPTIAAQLRRLHDTNRSGWWLLAFYILYCGYLYLTLGNMEAIAAGDMSSLASVGMVAIVMLIYSIVLIVFYVMKGTTGDNRYGPDPLAGEAVAAI